MCRSGYPHADLPDGAADLGLQSGASKHWALIQNWGRLP